MHVRLWQTGIYMRQKPLLTYSLYTLCIHPVHNILYTVISHFWYMIVILYLNYILCLFVCRGTHFNVCLLLMEYGLL